MDNFSSLLFALLVSLDNFAVATIYGMKKVRISIMGNLIIALISSLSTFIAITMGKFFVDTICPNIINISGSIILIIIGLWCIINPYFKKKRNHTSLLSNPEKLDLDCSGTIDFKEAFGLAIALMLNNIGFGLATSMTNINIPKAALLTFLLSIFTVLTGYYIGKIYMSSYLGNHAELISGILIIILGLINL